MIKWLVITVTLLAIVLSPFISWGKCDHDVIADVARMYGFEPHEYEVVMVSGKVLNASGDEVTGKWEHEDDGVHIITIQKSIFRPITVQTIFHEFAHAAQLKYNLYEPVKDKYQYEQHAELIAFNVMWQTGYWWNAVHSLFMHAFSLKPKEYLATREIWTTAFTGTKSVDFRPNL